MICPLMSKVVATSCNPNEPSMLLPGPGYEECLKEKCELWLKADSTHQGECSFKRIALGPRVYRTGP